MIALSVPEKKNPEKQQRWAKISGPFHRRQSFEVKWGLGSWPGDFFLIENEAP